MSLTSTIARFVAESRPDRVAEPVQDEAVRALVEWLGCCLGGCLEPALDAAIDRGLGAEEATLPGRGKRGNPASVALCSAIASSALDFAGVHAPTGVAASVPVASALLPLAEARASTGMDLVHAYVLGAEMTCRLAHALGASNGAPRSHTQRACGSIGAAVSCAKLLQLDATRMRYAIELAASAVRDHGMPSSPPLPDVALAARDGVAAALLAQHDISDRMRPLDSDQDALAVLGIAPGDALLQDLGEQWQWARMAYKPYPCDSALHAAIEATLGARARHRPLARHIAGVEVRVHPAVCERADVPAPRDSRQARRSLQHAVAAALIDGTMGLEQFGERRMASVRVAEMRARIALRGDASLPADSAHVALRLSDGRVLEHGVRCARGHPARPLGDTELSEKFRELASGVLATDQAERLLALAWNVRSLADIGALVRASVPEDALDPLELPGSPLIPR